MRAMFFILTLGIMMSAISASAADGGRGHPDAALAICDSMWMGNAKQMCIAEIESFQHSDEAVNFCASSGFYTNFGTVECLKETRNAYFSVPGLRVCETMESDSWKISCLQHIRNKQYNGDDVKACMDMTESSQKVDCL